CASYRHDSLPEPVLRRRRAGGEDVTEARGEVISVDRFGNAVTNLRPLEGLKLLELRSGTSKFQRLSRAYGDVKKGEPLILVESTGYLEIAVNLGNAAEELRLKPGDRVVAVWRSGIP